MLAGKGFTLIEVVVAMTIFTVVMTAIYGGFNTGARMWRRSEWEMQTFQDARVTLSLMSKELRCALRQAGHLFYGRNSRSGEVNTDRIEFFTVRSPLEPGKSSEPRILKVAYYLDGARGRRRGYVLKREERIVKGRIPTEKEMAGGRESQEDIEMERAWPCVIATNVRSLDFQYSWREGWTRFCEQGFGLPAIVRIVIELEGEGERPATRRFETAVGMPLVPGEGPTQRQRK